jgi:hypothetical protein
LKVSENRVLRRICETKREEVKGDSIKLHNEKLNNLYFSSNLSRMTKSKRMRLKRHVAHMGKIRNVYNIWVGREDVSLKTQAQMGGII